MSDLFKTFDPVNEKQWKTAVQAELKGADYAETLITAMPEGFDVKPLYTKNDVNHESFLAEKNNWKIVSNFIPTTQIPYDSLDGIQLKASQLKEYMPSDSELIFSTFENELPPIQALNKNNFLDWDFLGDLVEFGNYPSLSQEKTLVHFNQIRKESSYQNSLAINISRYQNSGANHAQQLAFMLLEAAEYVAITDDTTVLS
ncbi:MAG: hypothetical protein ACR2MS_10310, partial [Weeksellaceae bacterium]